MSYHQKHACVGVRTGFLKAVLFVNCLSLSLMGPGLVAHAGSSSSIQVPTSELILNRPSSSWVGSVRVIVNCTTNLLLGCTCKNALGIARGACDSTAYEKCVSLSQQNHPYAVGPIFSQSFMYAAAGGRIVRYSGGSCDGDSNARFPINVNQNGPTQVDVVPWP